MGSRQELFSGALKLPVYNGWGWTSWGWMSRRPASISGCFFLLEMEGKLSLPHSPSWSSCLGNTSVMCEVLPFSFTQPQGKQILTSGAPAIARGHTHGQAAETGEKTPLNINTLPPTTHTHTHTPTNTHTHTLLVWMGVNSDQEVEALGARGIDFSRYAPHQKFLLSLSDVS